MKKVGVVYPCWWTYALIGPDEEALRLALGEVAKGEKMTVNFSKASEHKKYISLHVHIWVDSADKRDRLFRAFKSHPHVKMVL
jgi:putative lipoic acid-binding regulatory protein